MNMIPAQEIKRLGLAPVDDLIDKGDLHVIRNNQKVEKEKSVGPFSVDILAKDVNGRFVTGTSRKVENSNILDLVAPSEVLNKKRNGNQYKRTWLRDL